MTIATVVLSGGQDSTLCLGLALAKYGPGNVRCVSFEYGQRHAAEIDAAARVIEHYETAIAPAIGERVAIPHDVVYLGDVFAGTSPLTNRHETLDAYTDAASMEAEVGDRIEKTFVPMRNAVFLMLAANRAVCAGSYTLVTGVCEADNANYPDCRRDFIDASQETINEALGSDPVIARRILRWHGVREGLGTSDEVARTAFVIETPLMYLSKAESVKLALRTPHAYAALAYSHTAYDGKYPPRGSDHASILRADGFEKAGVPDPLVMRAVGEGLMELPATSNYAPEVLGDIVNHVWSASKFAWLWNEEHA